MAVAASAGASTRHWQRLPAVRNAGTQLALPPCASLSTNLAKAANAHAKMEKSDAAVEDALQVHKHLVKRMATNAEKTAILANTTALLNLERRRPSSKDKQSAERKEKCLIANPADAGTR